MDHRHLWVRSTRQWAILRIRATIVHTIRNWLDDHGFLLVDTPIISPAAGESTSELFEIGDFDEAAHLAPKGQPYKQTKIPPLGKGYCFGPTLHAAKSQARRHLTDIWLVEADNASSS